MRLVEVEYELMDGPNAGRRSKFWLLEVGQLGARFFEPPRYSPKELRALAEPREPVFSNVFGSRVVLIAGSDPRDGHPLVPALNASVGDWRALNDAQRVRVVSVRPLMRAEVLEWADRVEYERAKVREFNRRLLRETLHS